ncbi:MAG: hypothetical protein JJU00_06265 [Opitutales bacterium]|nr:hypothetical protein [Opitutales bacterium]
MGGLTILFARTARAVCARFARERLLLVLAAAFVILLALRPGEWSNLPALVDWNTIGALAGLMLLSRALEDSGYLERLGRALLSKITGERTLALCLVAFAAVLSAFVTNDVALFIVVPLTVGMRVAADIPLGRLVVFQALAVNAGSAVSPIGNPQNLFLWQVSGMGFLEFTMMMAPLAVALTVLLLIAVPIGFPRRAIAVRPPAGEVRSRPRLLMATLPLYPVFIVLADKGWPVTTALALVALYLCIDRRVVAGTDWFLLAVFVLMFLNLGIVAGFGCVATLFAGVDTWPGGVFGAAALLSQGISNVPATLFLAEFTDDWRALAWGATVGGFGFAVGSLANLIALRLAREPGLWREFHLWSVPALALGTAAALVLIWVF